MSTDSTEGFTYGIDMGTPDGDKTALSIQQNDVVYTYVGEEADAIMRLIAQATARAELMGRIAELEKNHRWMERLCAYVDEPDAMQEYDERIKALKSQLESMGKQ